MAEINNKEDALNHLRYARGQINRMTPGNLTHHRNSIAYNLDCLEEYLSRSKKGGSK